MANKKLSADDIILHRKSFKNADTVKQSTKCGCYYCCRIFDASEIKEWWDDGKTAVCPYCGIDSVIQDANTEITPAMLKKMNETFF